MFRSTSQKNAIKHQQKLGVSIASESNSEPENFEDAMMMKMTSEYQLKMGGIKATHMVPIKETPQYTKTSMTSGKQQQSSTKHKNHSLEVFDVNPMTESQTVFQSQKILNLTGQQFNLNGSAVTASKNKRSFKLDSRQQGAFAFKSEADLVQPFYPLKFKEHDLALQLDYEELEAKGHAQKGEAVVRLLRKTYSVSQKYPSGAGDVDKPKTPPISVSNLRKLLGKEITDKKGAGNAESTIKMYTLGKVRYNGGRKFPFELASDVPRTIKKSLEAINMHKIPGGKGLAISSFDMEHQRLSTLLQVEGSYNSVQNSQSFSMLNPCKSKAPGATKHATQKNAKPNELLLFIAYNESGFNNMVVYLFWIIMQGWFTDDHESVNFPPKFLNEIREALTEQYRVIYFNYLIRLHQEVMDSIMDILPFLLAEIVRTLIQTKLRNQELPLYHNKAFVWLISAIFRELYGYETSELSLKQQTKLYVKSFAERIQENVKRSQFNERFGKLSKAKQNISMTRDQIVKEGGVLTGATTYIGSKIGQFVKNTGAAANYNDSSVYSHIYRTPRDKCNNDRDFSQEIKVDLVNEMLTEWSKISSVEAKATISEQINGQAHVVNPSQVFTPESKSNAVSQSRKSKRRSGTLQVGQLQSNSVLNVQGAQNQASRRFARKGTVQSKHNSGMPMPFMEGFLVSQSQNDSPKPEKEEKDIGLHHSESMSSWFNKPNNKQKQEVLNGNTSTLRACNSKNNFSKHKIKVKEYVPKPRHLGLERLKKTLKENKKTIASNVEGHQAKGIDNKHQDFNLQHLSPIIEGKFPSQLFQNFSEQRKQKSMSLSLEPDPDRIEPYMLLQYELKQYLKARQNDQGYKDAEKLLAGEIQRKKLIRKCNSQSSMAVTKAEQKITKTLDQFVLGPQLIRVGQMDSSFSKLSEQKATTAAKLSLFPDKGVMKMPTIHRNQSIASYNSGEAVHESAALRSGENTRAVRFKDSADLKFQAFNIMGSLTTSLTGMYNTATTGSAESSDQKAASSKTKQQFTEKTIYDHNLMFLAKKSIDKASRLFGEELGNRSLSSGRSIGSLGPSPIKHSITSIDAEEKKFNSLPRSMQKSASAQQGLPPLGTNKLGSIKRIKKSPLIAGIRTKKRAHTVTFEDTKRAAKAQEVIDNYPAILEEDLGKMMYRKTTKLLAKGKYILAKDGSKYAPLGKQLIDFMHQPDLEVDYDRILIQEYMRNRIRNSLPPDLRKRELSKAFKMPNPPDFLASKHTFASMKKIASTLSRKQFVFDDTDAMKKRYEIKQIIINKNNRNKISQSQPNLAAFMPAQQQAHHRSKNVSQEAGRGLGMQPNKSHLQSSQVADTGTADAGTSQQNLKTYHVHKGSHYSRYGKKKDGVGDVNYSDDMSGLPPTSRPQDQNSKRIQGTTSNQRNQGLRSAHSNSSVPLAIYEQTKSQDKVLEPMQIDSNSESFGSDGKDFIAEQLYLNQQLNDLDDKADVRDGIAQTKGKIMKASGEDLSRLKLAPREQTTKISRMLKDMRGFLDRESERRATIRATDQLQMEVIDSEEEAERHEEGDDIFVARPNPLEPQPKPKKNPKAVDRQTSSAVIEVAKSGWWSQEKKNDSTVAKGGWWSEEKKNNELAKNGWFQEKKNDEVAKGGWFQEKKNDEVATNGWWSEEKKNNVLAKNGWWSQDKKNDAAAKNGFQATEKKINVATNAAINISVQEQDSVKQLNSGQKKPFEPQALQSVFPIQIRKQIKQSKKQQNTIIGSGTQERKMSAQVKKMIIKKTYATQVEENVLDDENFKHSVHKIRQKLINQDAEMFNKQVKRKNMFYYRD